MFISHFNRYFEKHAKLTYFVLLVIIIATFVIFVTPGSMRGGNEARLKDFGKMYGKTLGIEKIQKEMNKSTLTVWLIQGNLFGYDFSSQKALLFNDTLNHLRIQHYAKEKGLDTVTDDEMRDRIQKFDVVKDENGNFSKENFDKVLEFAKQRLGLEASDFDQVVKELIIQERVIESVKGRVAVSDSEIDDVLAQYSLKYATIKMNLHDAQPTEAEIQDFFAGRKAEITLPESKTALAALFNYDAVRKSMGDKAIPSADEIAKRYNANKETAYKDKSLAEATAAISAAIADERVRAEARRLAANLYKGFQNAVEGEAQADRSKRFRTQAETTGAAVIDTGVVALDSAINGLGNQERLADAIRKVAEVGGVTPMVVGDKFAAVAMVLTKEATKMPESLPELNAANIDALRHIISETIIHEKALAFFQKSVKEPYDNFQNTVNVLKEDRTLSDAQKQQMLMTLQSSIDTDLLNRFYVPEKRSFAQVTFAPENYEAQVAAVTADEISAAFEARAEEFKKDNKTLDDVKAALENDIKAAKARAIADEAAAQFANDFSEAFWKAREANADADGAALLEKLAGEIPQARFERIENFDPNRINASNSEVLSAVYSSTLTAPVSSAIIGLDASYVTCLTGITEGRLAEPTAEPEYYTLLETEYVQNAAMVSAQTKAQAEFKRVADALAANGGDLDAAAGDALKFAELPVISLNDIYKNAETVTAIQNSIQVAPAQFADELSKIKAAGALLMPLRAQQVFRFSGMGNGMVIPVGYQLIYVADRKAPEATEDITAVREEIKTRLLDSKQNDELNSFIKTLDEQSKTELRAGNPYIGGDAE
ncbi:MAG: hypothetical protein MJ106_04785 [Lentisphaeria bacterium]|nr:hypothetical protein [Lentisphaeria bacterium]